jgi:hypothetical protein
MKPTAHIAKLLRISKETPIRASKSTDSEGVCFDYRDKNDVQHDDCIHKSNLTVNDMKRIRLSRYQ